MHNVLLVYKQLSLQFDKSGKLLPWENGEVAHASSYDEKPGIQAIATTSEDLLPNEKHCCISRDYEYKRLGTLYPKGDKIRMVLDNLKVHTSEETRKYLAAVPGRFEFVFTPKHGSWLNMVESFFSKMTKQMLRGIRVQSKEELAERIYLYFYEVNAEPVVSHWKYNLDDIDVSEEIIVDKLSIRKSIYYQTLY